MDSETAHLPGAAESASPRRSVGHRVAIAMGSIAALAVALCVVLLALISKVADLVGDMRRDELAIHEGLMLGVAVREQYIHEAHTLIEHTDTHLAHHHSWVEEVRRSAELLEDRVPEDERWRVDRIADASATIDEAFRGEVVPALERGDLERVRAEHQQIDVLVTQAAGDANAVATSIEARMHHSHVRAESIAQTAAVVAGIGGLLALVLALYHGWRVRTRVIQPLAGLAAATALVARGEIPPPLQRGDREVVEVGAAIRRLALALREREARLVASERMAVVGQLAAGVAHEVNNPVGIIRGYLRTMIPEAQSAQQMEELKILDEEALACQTIAEDLLAFARTDDVRLEETDVRSLVSDLVHRLEASGRLDGASVEVRVQSALLPLDPGRMKQALTNLLRNAAQADAGGSIEIRGNHTSSGYRIEVRDRGDGVASEDRDKIFEPFFGRRRGGSGLGLAVCLGVVRAHGGRIHVEDNPGRGAVFVIHLPTPETERAA